MALRKPRKMFSSVFLMFDLKIRSLKSDGDRKMFYEISQVVIQFLPKILQKRKSLFFHSLDPFAETYDIIKFKSILKKLYSKDWNLSSTVKP